MYTPPNTLTVAVAFALWSTASHADRFTDTVVQRFQELGFEYIEIKEGIGQLKVEAIKGSRKLEVIYDRDTGKILKQETERASASEIGRTGVDIDRRDEDFVSRSNFDSDERDESDESDDESNSSDESDESDDNESDESDDNESDESDDNESDESDDDESDESDDDESDESDDNESDESDDNESDESDDEEDDES